MSLLFSLEENRRISEALAARRLCTGRLMTPQDVAVAVQGRNPDPTIVRGWFLCGDLAPEMYSKETLLTMGHLGQTFRGPGGLTYLVWAQQCGHWQHRFVVQLTGEDASDYLTFVRENPTWFSLADSGSEKALLVKAPEFLRKVIPPDLPVLPAPASFLALAEGLMWVGLRMLEPGALCDPGFPEVTDVCVSIVQMPSVVRNFMQMNSAGGTSAH